MGISHLHLMQMTSGHWSVPIPIQLVEIYFFFFQNNSKGSQTSLTPPPTLLNFRKLNKNSKYHIFHLHISLLKSSYPDNPICKSCNIKKGPTVHCDRMSLLQLSSFSTYPASQLNILWHDGNSLGVDGTQICIFKETNQVCLTCLL